MNEAPTVDSVTSHINNALAVAEFMREFLPITAEGTLARAMSDIEGHLRKARALAETDAAIDATATRIRPTITEADRALWAREAKIGAGATE